MKQNIVDLKQLKTWGTLDSNSYNELINHLDKSVKVLILSPRDSGKSTVQASIVNHFHMKQKELLVVPSINGVSLKNYKTNKKIKTLRSIIKNFSAYIAAIEYKESPKSDIKDISKYFLNDFDLIIDLRNIDGNRVVYNLIKGQKRVNYKYTHPEFEKRVA